MRRWWVVGGCVAAGLAAAGPAGPMRADEPGATRLFKSGPIQITADGRWVWVADAHADAVERIDTASHAVARFALPDPGTRDVPRGLSVTEDGAEVWVAAHDADRVYVLDGGDGRVTATIDLPWGSGPYSVALSRPDTAGVQRWALVALHRSSRLAVVDTATRVVTILPPVYRSPHGLAWIDDGATAWVTHLFGDGEHPHYSRVDVAGGVPRVSAHANAFAASPRHSGQLGDGVAERNVAEGGYLNWRGHPAQLPARAGKRQLWIPTQYMSFSQDVPTPDSIIQASLRRLDLDTGRVLGDDKVILSAVQVHDPTRGDNNPPWQGYGWNAGVSGLVDIGFAEVGDALFAVVAGEQSNDVVVLPWDTPPFKSRTDPAAPGLPEVGVGDRPMGLAVSPVAPTAFVYNAFSFDVSVIDLTDARRPREAGRIALGGPVADDLLADATLLAGARLFYGSTDPRVSGNQKVACASCHLNGEHDSRHWDFHRLPPGTAGQKHGPRSTINLLGIGRTHTPGRRDAVTGWGQLHRSGDRDEIQDFDHTFTGPHMGGTGFLGAAAQPELGPPNAGRDADLDALASYLLAVPPLARSPYRAPDGGLTDAAERGATLFMGRDDDKPGDAACAACHVPADGFVDFGFHDVGTNRPAGEQELNDAARRGRCLWCGHTPALVGVWDTAPYEGVYRWPETFVDVLLDFADPARPAPHGRVGGLTGRQLEDLAVFVQSIDGDLGAGEVERARDDRPPVIARVAPTSRTRVEVWFSETVDAATAVDVDNYRLTRTRDGAAVAIHAARRDDRMGDRVTLVTDPLDFAAGGVAYTLGPSDGSGLRDAAGTVSGGAANVVDPADPANRHTFTLTDTLTITLGASGDANVVVDVHDASPVGPGLATWSHDRVQVVTAGEDNVTPGFVRFAWRSAFVAATNISDAGAIRGAEVALHGSAGDARELELRRVLQGWGDPAAGGDWNSNPTGGPTWRDHAHPSAAWNHPGAGALGGTGNDPGDYDGRFDLAASVDAVAVVPAVNSWTVFGGAGVAEAFRFWFDHPHLDYGFALRARPTRPSQVVMTYDRWESALGRHGPRLTLTYRLPGIIPTQTLATATITPGGDLTRTPEGTPTPGRDRTATPGREASRTPTRTVPSSDRRRIALPWLARSATP